MLLSHVRPGFDARNLLIVKMEGLGETLTAPADRELLERLSSLADSAGAVSLNTRHLADLTFANCRSYGVMVEAENASKNIQIYNCQFPDETPRELLSIRWSKFSNRIGRIYFVHCMGTVGVIMKMPHA